MRYAIGAFLMLHGFAHLVGFIVSFRIANIEESPYKTTLLADRINVGDFGIRVIGVLWIVAAIAFMLAGAGVILRMTWWEILTLYISIGSLVLSISGWPESRIGVIVNIVILTYLIFGGNLGWLPKIES